MDLFCTSGFSVPVQTLRWPIRHTKVRTRATVFSLRARQARGL